MSDASQIALLLTNRIVEVGVKPLTAREFWSIYEAYPKLENLLNFNDLALADVLGCNQNDAIRYRSLLDAGTAFAFEQERLQESGIKVVSFLDAEYPQRLLRVLGNKSSVFLLIAGAHDLDNAVGRGIVGSRNVGPEAVEIAQLAAGRATRSGDVVISGLARGIDQIAMTRALEFDGRVIGIPTEGIRRIARTGEIRNLVHEGKVCLISPYGPDAPFSVGAAMGRNKMVYALAESTLVVASDLEKGGTWEGAKEALKGRFAQVDVWTGSGCTEGNLGLVKLGARPVSTEDDLWKSRFEPPPVVEKQETLF